jgi:hypothetical protein
MPGSVGNAAPTVVLPWSLCRAFRHSREFAILENDYRDGTSQRSLLVETSRKSWRLSKRLAPAALTTLRSFWDARHGPLQEFYFYDPWDTNPRFSYDPTGVATEGRYTVRFDGAWEQSCDIARADVDIALVQLA